MTRRYIVSFAVALLVACGLSGCSIGPLDLDDFLATQSVEEARAARRAELAPVISNSVLKQENTLTVGLLASQGAPLCISSDGATEGIDVDMAYALADELGLSSVSFVTVENVDSALEQTCDIVMGVDSDEELDATIVGGYAQRATGVFTCEDVTAPIDASELSGATVGLQEGSVSALTLSDYDLTVVREPFSNLNEAFEALEAGEVSYVVCDAYAGAYLAAAYADVSFAGIIDEPVQVGVAVSGTELTSAVQGALETVQTNGIGSVALAQWVGDLPTLTEATTVTGLVPATDSADEQDDASADDGSATTDTDGSSDAADDGTSAE